MGTCGHCQAPRRAKARYCYRCGQRLVGDDPPLWRHWDSMAWIAIVLCLLVVAPIIAALFHAYTDR